MISFSPLDQHPFGDVMAVMRRAFEHYFVPISLTDEAWANACHDYGVEMDRSLAIEMDGQLVGFTFFAYDGKRVYDASTGIAPEGRGHGATTKLFAAMEEAWQEAGIESVQLEVIVQNEPAIRSYQKAGLEIVRKLDLYKVQAFSASLPEGYTLHRPTQADWPKWHTWREWEPTWQHHHRNWERRAEGYHLFTVQHQGETVAYLLGAITGRLSQMAVHPDHRRKGIGRSLMAQLTAEAGGTINVSNIQSDHEDTKAFLQSLNAEHYLQQYEMVRKLSR